MIRRNIANQTIAFPELVLRSDSSVVTSGATLRIKKDSSETTDAAGSLSHDESGIWVYTPTQSETDCAILKLYLKATDAVSIVFNLVTTAADTSDVAFGNTTVPLDSTQTQAAAAAAILAADVANETKQNEIIDLIKAGELDQDVKVI